VITVVEAGDACCKAEAARRALKVPDPFAKKPPFWDDEDDGPWQAPKVAMVDLPGWYRLKYETQQGLMGAAPWLITGVIAAALLTTIAKPLFPSSALRSVLGNNSYRGTAGAVIDSIRGSIFGLLVPFCSCGALPLALALKQEGISSSSIAAFVTAAQAAGIDSLFFTYGIFGAHVAALRLAAAGFLAFAVGMAVAKKDNGNVEDENSNDAKESKSKDKSSCCGTDGSSKSTCQEETQKADKAINVIDSVSLFFHTAIELFSSVAVWVLLGVIISASASIWAPPTSAASSAPSSSVTFLSGNGDVFSMAKSVISRASLFSLSLPMTICEHGIVSLADALQGVGFSAGTAVALIVIGPSTNAGTLLLLSRLNGGKQWVVDAFKIVSVILVFGVALSFLADDFGSSVMMEKQETTESSGGGGSALPEWLNENAITLAGLFTTASVVQSSLVLFRSTSQKSSSTCS